MKTEFDEDSSAKLAIVICFALSIFLTVLYFWPAAAMVGDMVRDKELNAILGFFAFISAGGIIPIGSFFAGIYIFAVIHTKIEDIVFSRNRKLKQAAEFIIEARGNK